MTVCLFATLGLIAEATSITYVSDSDGVDVMVIGAVTDTDALLELSGLEMNEGDSIYYTSYTGNLGTLNIQRAFDAVVVADGVSTPVHMTQGTVEKALELAGVTLGELDYTTPSLHAELEAGDIITVHRVEYKDSVEYEAIAYETEYQYTSLFWRDKSHQMVIQDGYEGELAITSRERWVDGELESSQISGTEVTREPQNYIVKVYGEDVPVSSLTGPDGTTNAPTTYTQVLTGRGTGYYSATGKGSSGLGLGYGTIAVNPNIIPYGTLVYIESTDGNFVYGYAIATDTGIALMDGTCLVDMFYETYEESCLNWVHEVNVYIVG